MKTVTADYFDPMIEELSWTKQVLAARMKEARSIKSIKDIGTFDHFAGRLAIISAEIRSLTEKADAKRKEIKQVMCEDRWTLDVKRLRYEIISEIQSIQFDFDLWEYENPIHLKYFLRRSQITAYQIQFAYGTWFKALKAADGRYESSAPLSGYDELTIEMRRLKEILK